MMSSGMNLLLVLWTVSSLYDEDIIEYIAAVHNSSGEGTGDEVDLNSFPNTKPKWM